MKVFIDFEFTGLHQNTTPISIGCVSENGARFYAEFTDYDESQVDDWIKENVIKHLWSDGQAIQTPVRATYTKGSKTDVAQWLLMWLQKWDEDGVEIWSDCYAYDWVLFCELFGGALSIPKFIYYIPFDLSTLLWSKGHDPDINRREFADMEGAVNHNALDDAEGIRACYMRLMRRG